MAERTPDCHVVVTYCARVLVEDLTWRTNQQLDRSSYAGRTPASGGRWHEIVQMVNTSAPRELTQAFAVGREVAPQQAFLTE